MILSLLKKHAVSLICLLLSCTGFILDWNAFCPGFLSPDTIDQYTQAKAHHFGDWHPPVMSYLWSLLLNIHNGPEPMLFLQLFLLWASFFLFLKVLVKHYPYLSWLAIVFALMPFVQNFAGNVWKDVHMTMSWFLAGMIMTNAFYQRRHMNIAEAAISFLAICYGCWLRSNALPGAIPLTALWLVTTFHQETKGWKNLLILSGKTLALILIIIGLQSALTRLIKPDKNYIEYKLFVQDLSGIYLKTGDYFFPDFVVRHAEMDTVFLRKKYTIHTFDQFWWNEEGKHIFPMVIGEKEISEIKSYWLKAIIKHPGAYLKIKMEGFLYFLRIKDSGTRLWTFYPYIHPNDFGFTYTPGKLGEFFVKWMYKVEHKIYMQPWFWTLLNLLIVIIAFLKPLKACRPVILGLSLSALFYLAAEFFVFPADTEFRYFYWNCIAVSVSLIIAVSEACYYYLRKRKASEV